MRDIDSRLEAHFGPLKRRALLSPVEALVLATLSQNTTDANADRAFRKLREAFPTWADLRRAEAPAVEDAIRTAGLARTKAPRILRVLQELEAAGDPDLSNLTQMDDDDAQAFLEAFEGIGPKTARCVLLFGLGRDVFPIDTHIHRVLRRVGAIPAGTNAAQAHRDIVRHIPSGRAHPLHVRLILLGKRLCRPTRPACRDCPLQPVCEHAAQCAQDGSDG